MIEINNLTTNRIEEGFLRKVAEKVLKREKKGGLELSIALVGPGRIRELNKKYKRRNRVTDVLSFSYSSKAKSEDERMFIDHNNSGELAICVRQVIKNAKRLGLVPDKELARVLIHGILHLLGYDHEENEAEAEKMEKKQEDYLKLFFQ